MSTHKRRKRKKANQANFLQVVKTNFKEVILTPKTPGQKEYIRAVHNNDITFCTGPAGSGKTHVAIGMAVQMVRQGLLDRIIISRPLVSVGKDMGYLPGDIENKVGPYVMPCFDELNYYLPLATIKLWQQERKIEILPLSMMRGRTLNNAFILLDEAQNATFLELKMLVTRIGNPSKLVLAGDVDQIDLNMGGTAPLLSIITKLDGLHGVYHAKLNSHDIVRHTLIKDILSRLR